MYCILFFRQDKRLLQVHIQRIYRNIGYIITINTIIIIKMKFTTKKIKIYELYP